MFDPTQMLLLIVVLITMVLSGIHIAISLLTTAFLGLYLMQGDMHVASTFISNSAYEVIRDYVFAVIPLFMLMGEFLAKCGAAERSVCRRATGRPSGCRDDWPSPPCSPTPSSPSSPASASRRPPPSRASSGRR